MKIVVPLAGPDFERPDGSVKARIVVEGEPLLRRALGSRPWAAQANAADYVFVLRDSEPSRAFAASDLAAWYPGARCVWLSASTRGAALSTLAGAGFLDADDRPLIVDLADILFDSTLDPAAAFRADSGLGGILPLFTSDNPLYSYAVIGASGWIASTAEKRVISDQASAGVYLFRSLSVYLRALAHNLDHADRVTHNNLFFVCPLMNGVIDAGYRVAGHAVTKVRDIKV